MVHPVGSYCYGYITIQVNKTLNMSFHIGVDEKQVYERELYANNTACYNKDILQIA